MHFKKIQGSELLPYLGDVAALRMEVFREFPYLYEGTKEYELEYLDRYLRCPSSFMALAFSGDSLIGATTCIPMEFEDENFREPVVKAGIDVARTVYFGESIVRSSYRGKGIGRHFFDFRHEYSRQCMDNLRYTCFCSVVRDENHPARPANYRPLDEFWQRQGYVLKPGMVAKLPWHDVGEKTETEKSLVYWLREW